MRWNHMKSQIILDVNYRFVEDCWRFLDICGWWLQMTSTQSLFATQKQFVAKSCRLASASPSARQPSFAAPAPVLALASPLVEPNTVWPCLTTVNMCSMAWRCLKVPKSIKHRQCAPPCLSLSPSLPLPCQIQTCGHQTPHIRHGYSNSTATVSHVTFSALWNHVVSLCCSNERMLVGSVLGVVLINLKISWTIMNIYNLRPMKYESEWF